MPFPSVRRNSTLVRRRVSGSAQRVAAASLLVVSAAVALAPVALAAGSANLYPSGASGSRGNYEWRTGSYGGGVIMRRTLLRVYAKANEYIEMGSSAVGQGSADVLLWTSDQVSGPYGNETLGTPAFTCSQQRTSSGIAAQGEITSRTAELTGPDTMPTSTVAGAYIPCYYQVPTNSIYAVAFIGPAGTSSNADGGVQADVALSAPGDFNTSQGTSVAAWDVTVRTSLSDATTTQAGRVFTYALAAFTGSNGRPVNFTTYVVTNDGFRYRLDENKLDPNGWTQYASQEGFLDPNGTPLYHDALATSAGSPGQLTNIAGGVTFAAPTYPTFFEPPDSATLAALGIPATASPPGISSVTFAGSRSGNTSFHQTGGTFTITSSTGGVYAIVISRDGVNWDPTAPQNRVLRGVAAAGTSTASWDGKSNAGQWFPPNTAGSSYPFHATMHAGEYHFPFIDAENDINGGPVLTMLNPPGGTCPSFNGGCHGAFYDDRGYTTTTGVTVGTPGSVLCGLNPPATPNSDPINGFDTTTTQRAYGANPGSNTNTPCTGSFGDAKGLDLWTYYPTAPITGTLDVIPTADVGVDVSADNATPDLNGTVTFTVHAVNNGPDTAHAVIVSNPLPAGMVLLSSSASQGTWDSGTGTWSVGDLSSTDVATLTLRGTVVTENLVTDNVSRVSQTEPDPVASNDTASASVTPQYTDIGVSIAASSTTPNVNAPVTISVTATDNGPDNARTATISVPLPAGLTYVSSNPSQGTTYDPVSGDWTLAAGLGVSASATLQINATVTTATPQTVTATRTQTAPPDVNASNDSAFVTIDGQQADISVAEHVSNATPNVGSNVTFTTVLTNGGPSDATGISLSVPLPSDLTFVSRTPGRGTYDPSTGIWNVGALAHGASTTLELVVKVTSTVTDSVTATKMSETQYDPTTLDDIAAASVTGQEADVQVHVTVDHPSVTTGNSATYTVTVYNAGPDTATGVTVGTALPPGVTADADTVSQGSFNASTGAWHIGTLPVGATATYTVTVTVLTPGNHTEAAAVTAADQPDPVVSNNSDAATVTGVAPATPAVPRTGAGLTGFAVLLVVGGMALTSSCAGFVAASRRRPRTAR